MEYHTKWTKTILVLLSSALSFSTYAASSFAENKKEKSWKPVLTLGVGPATLSSLGASTSFPIVNPSTDQYFIYSPSNAIKTSPLFEGFVGAEWNYRPDWAIQVGVDYNQSSPYLATGTLTQGVDTASQSNFNYYYDVLTRQVLLAGKLLYTYKNIFHPYLFAGVGAAFNRASHYSTTAGFLTFTRMYGDRTTTSFSYAVGLGVDLDLTQDWRLGVGYRFAGLGRTSLGNAVINTTPVSGTLKQANINANELLVQFTWKF